MAAQSPTQETVTVALSTTIDFRDPRDGELKRLGPNPSVELPLSTARALGIVDLSGKPLERYRPVSAPPRAAYVPPRVTDPSPEALAAFEAERAEAAAIDTPAIEPPRRARGKA